MHKPEENAGVVVYLLSDLSHGLTGQVVAIRGSRIGIMRPPHLSGDIEGNEGWSVAAVEQAFRGPFSGVVQELGAPPTI